MIIAIASQKGGTGKTTTSVTLAAGLSQRGKRILLVDIDAQANSSKVILPDYATLRGDETILSTILERESLPIRQTPMPNLDIVPSHILLSNTDVELTTAKDHRESRLKDQLAKVAENYDHIIIDCPPALGWLTINAFTACDSVIVPVSPGYFELDSIVQIGKSIDEVRSLFNPNLKLLGFLFTMHDPTINSRDSLKILRQSYTDQVLNTVIPRNTDIRDAHFQKQDIFAFRPSSKSAHAYNRLIDEIQL